MITQVEHVDILDRRGQVGGRLDSLTGLRFFAALLVALGHLANSTHLAVAVSTFFDLGGVGVTFFFMLSGFVLAWSYRPELPVVAFYFNRLARIYPLHLLTWVAAAFLILLLYGQTWHTGSAISCLLLVQAWVPSQRYYFGMNAPSWSLSCEVFFYALFPFVVRLLARCTRHQPRRLFIGLGVICAPFTLAMTVLLRSSEMKVWILYTDPIYRLDEFVVGVALGLLVRDGWRPVVSLRGATWLVCIAYSLLAMLEAALRLGILDVPGRSPGQFVPSQLVRLIMLPPLALLIVSTAAADLSGKRAILSTRPLVRLGHWSFALYLSHFLVIQVVESVAPISRSWWMTVAMGLVILAAAVGISGALYIWVEQPAEAKLRNWGTRRFT